MTAQARLVLNSFQDGRAVVDVAFGDRRARLDLDRLDDCYPGQPAEERVREEIAELVAALNVWFEPPVGRLERH